MARDVFSVVTEQIVNQLKGGIVPWRRSWNGCGPTSYQSNQPYRGLYVFLLQSSYESPYWMTFNQAKKLGGSIRAGEHGRYIVYADSYMEKEIDETGRERLKPVRFLRYYTVFNWEQTKGIPEKKPVENENRQIIGAQEILIRRAPRIETADRAYYLPSRDIIGLPPLEKFNCSEEYYSTAYHELIHWSGSSLRLRREGAIRGFFGNQVYSQEELIAEMGAAYLCQIAQLDTTDTIQNSAAYIASWLTHLEKNPKWIVQASSKAREAVDFILTGQLLGGVSSAAAATA
jgi:antirestriction protein ArdC